MRTVRSSGRLSGGGVYLRGLSSPGGVCLLWGRGVVYSWGVSAPGEGVCSRGVCLLWGVSAPGGCGIPACTEAVTPPVDRQTPVET